VTDATLLSEHLLWEATAIQAGDNAFNVVNGDVFRWDNMWKKIADYFGVSVGEYPGHAQPLSDRLSTPEIADLWTTITKKHDLKSYKLSEIAPWWHVEADLGRTLECINSMNKSWDMGWKGHRNSTKSFVDLFDFLKKDKIIHAE